MTAIENALDKIISVVPFLPHELPSNYNRDYSRCPWTRAGNHRV